MTKERRSSVQAMQFSNGLNNPVGLWLGHLMFDTIVVVFIATVIIIVFAVAASQKFVGLGYLVSFISCISTDVMFMSWIVVHFSPIWNDRSAICILCITGRFFSLICLCDGICPSIHLLPRKIFLHGLLLIC